VIACANVSVARTANRIAIVRGALFRGGRGRHDGQNSQSILILSCPISSTAPNAFGGVLDKNEFDISIVKLSDSNRLAKGTKIARGIDDRAVGRHFKGSMNA